MIGAGGGAFTAISAAMAVPAVHSATRPTVASRSLFIMLSPCRPLLIARSAACCTAIIPQLPAETLRATPQTPRAIMATLKTFRRDIGMSTKTCCLFLRVALGIVAGNLVASVLLYPGRDIARGNQPSRQKGIERACKHDQSLIELLSRESPRLGFALECACLPWTSPLRQGPTLVHLECDVPGLRHPPASGSRSSRHLPANDDR